MPAWLERFTGSRPPRRSPETLPLELSSPEELCRQIVATSPDCVKVLDEQDRLLWLNPNGCRLMEIDDPDSVVGMSWLDLWQGAMRDTAQAALAQARTGGVGRFSGPAATAKGRLKWWDVVIVPMSHATGPAGRLLSVSRDVSELVSAAETQRALLSAERAAREDAERATAERDDLLATVCHEMRAPLQGILSWAALLQSKSEDPVSAEAGLSIHGATLHQLTILEGLLDRPASTADDLPCTPVSLAKVARAVVETTRAIAGARRVALEIDVAAAECAQIAGDAQTLRQVVMNLVANAIKFTPPGGCVTVSVRAAPLEVTATVQDTGRGISPEFMPRLFERYSREQTSGDAADGLGLGLFLTRRWVQALAGTITADSPGAGCGSTFAVSFPRLRAATASTPSAPPADVITDLTGVAIAIAAARQKVREAIGASLRRYGAQVVMIEGRAADLPSVEIDGLILDADDPGVAPVLEQLRAEGASSVAWVLGLTADHSPGRRKQGPPPGFDAIAAVPLRPRELARTVALLHARAG